MVGSIGGFAGYILGVGCLLARLCVATVVRAVAPGAVFCLPEAGQQGLQAEMAEADFLGTAFHHCRQVLHACAARLKEWL